MSRAFWSVILLAFASVYSSADSIIPHVTPSPVVSPSLSTPLVHPGGTFSVSINIAGVNNLAGFQFSFSFNPSVVSATGNFGGIDVSPGEPSPQARSTIRQGPYRSRRAPAVA